MIIIEYLGIKINDKIKMSHITDIYKDTVRLAHLSNEFISLAYEVLVDELKPGDEFKIIVKDKDNNILKEDIKKLAFIKNGIYYEEDN